MPSGLQDLSGIFSAPLAGYNLPLPFFSDASAPLWHAAVGYEITGILGILLVGGAVYAIARVAAGAAGRTIRRPKGAQP